MRKLPMCIALLALLPLAACSPTPTAPAPPAADTAPAAEAPDTPPPVEQAPVDDATATPAPTETEASPWDEARQRGVVLKGLGTEPFWSLEVDDGATPEMRLDLDMGERKLVVAQAAVLEQGAGYAGKADDGSDVTLRIQRGDCSDGMSDRTYPATISLEVGAQHYSGCGVFLQE